MGLKVAPFPVRAILKSPEDFYFRKAKLELCRFVIIMKKTPTQSFPYPRMHS